MFTTIKKQEEDKLEAMDMSGGATVGLKEGKTVAGPVIGLCMGTFFFGYALAYFSTLGPGIQVSQYGSAMGNEQVFGPCLGLIPLGAAAGVVIANLVMDKFYRRTFLMGLSILNLAVTGILQVNDIYVLFSGRLLQGFLVGHYMTLVPAYIGELGPSSLMSSFSIFPQISVVLGVLFAYSLGVIYTVTGLDPNIFWRLQMGFPFIPIVIQVCMCVSNYIPESPQSLLLGKQRDKAKNILRRWVSEQLIQVVLQEKTNSVNRTRDLAKTRVSNRALWLGAELAIYQNICGIASMVTQAGHVISKFNLIVGRYTPIVITIAQLIGTFLSIPLLKSYEWKHISLVGGIVLGTCDLILALLFTFYTSSINTEIMTASMVTIAVFMFTFGLTFGSSVWPYISRLLPRKNNIQGVLVVNWLMAAGTIISLSFTDYFISPPYPIFYVYAGASYILTFYNFFVLFPIKNLPDQQLLQKLT